jgi:hypothetical protein
MAFWYFLPPDDLWLMNVDKPISINKFHGTVMVKTPFKGYKSSSMEIDHDSTDKVKSMLKTEWPCLNDIACLPFNSTLYTLSFNLEWTTASISSLVRL